MSAKVINLTDRIEQRTRGKNDEIPAILGDEIRHSQQTFKDIAAKAGVCVSTVSRLAYHETKRPHFRTILLIAYALDFELHLVK